MKKYLNYILLGVAFLFAVLVFATMAGKAVHIESSLGILSGKATVYQLISHGNGIAVTNLVFLIIALVAIAAIAVLDVLNKYNKYNHFVALGVALLCFISFIMSFCYGTGDFDGWSLGAGAVLSALFMLVVSGATGTYGVLKLLKKM